MLFRNQPNSPLVSFSYYYTKLVNNLLDKHDIVLSVRTFLVDNGYDVSYADGIYGITEELSAKKGEDNFIVEAINPTPRKDADIVFALGKIIKRMGSVGIQYNYGIAMPHEYFRYLKDFEAAGFEALKIHLFLVDDYLSLKYIDPSRAAELICNLRAGQIVNPDLMT
jgi:hypothetical protein